MEQKKGWAELEGYKKIEHDGGTIVTVKLWNSNTKTIITIKVDDLEYEYHYFMACAPYKADVLEKLRYMPIDEAALLNFKKYNGLPYVGGKFVVTKGRKYPKGTIGTIDKLYDYTDNYGRWLALYALATGSSGGAIKINTANIKMLAD